MDTELKRIVLLTPGDLIKNQSFQEERSSERSQHNYHHACRIRVARRNIDLVCHFKKLIETVSVAIRSSAAVQHCLMSYSSAQTISFTKFENPWMLPFDFFLLHHTNSVLKILFFTGKSRKVLVEIGKGVESW